FAVVALPGHIGRLADAFRPGNLGAMHQAFDARLSFHERAVRHEIDDPAFDPRANRIFGFDVVPWIGQLLLESEADALLFAIDVEHDHVDLLADLEDLRRMSDAAPAHVGNVQPAVETV